MDPLMPITTELSKACGGAEERGVDPEVVTLER